jgi:hypothetical protein
MTPEEMRRVVEARAKESELNKKIRHSIRLASIPPLTDAQWIDPDCQSECDLLVRDLMRPGVMEMFALHEAAHEIYYREAGVPSFSFESPRITHTQETGFSFQRARIRLGPGWTQPEGDWLFKLAKGYAAGGQASLKIPDPSIATAGDENDRSEWGNFYATRFSEPRDEAMERKIKKMWEDAQKEVSNELDRESTQRVQQKANEIMPLLYPWLATHQQNT